MKIYEWAKHITPEETIDGAYWERNLLALNYAEGWYNDDVSNFPGWRRVLSLDEGRIAFHIPDTFEVGTLPEIKPNWDGHTTKEKWLRIMNRFGIKETK